jgi:biopolymer transport protein ExbD
MKLFQAESKKRNGINLTALVDILFLLIIFFAVSTQFTNQSAIGINLPESKTSSQVSIESKLIIIVQNDETLIINGQIVSWDAVGAIIKKDKYDRSQKVILNIDKMVVHGKVIKLLDVLKLNGFKKVVFGTYGSS